MKRGIITDNMMARVLDDAFQTDVEIKKKRFLDFAFWQEKLNLKKLT